MSEERNKPKRDRLVMALVILAILSFSCVLGDPALIFAIKFGWPRIRNRFYGSTAIQRLPSSGSDYCGLTVH